MIACERAVGHGLNAGLALLLGVLLAGPLVALMSIVGGESTAPTSAGRAEVIGRTLLLAFGGTAGSVALGTLAGFAVFALPRWSRAWCLGATLMAGLVPPYVYVVAWIEILGAQGLPGMELSRFFSVRGAMAILSMTHFPIVAWAGYVAGTRLDADKMEAARTEGTVWMAMRHVMLPHALPFIATGALIVFLLCLTNYTVPALMQVDTCATEIFTMFNAFHDAGAGIRGTLPVIVTAFVAIGIWMWIVRTRIAQGSFVELGDANLATGRGLRAGAILYLLALLGICVALPVATLIARSTGLHGIRAAWDSTRDEWGASLLLAAVSTITILGLSGAMAFASERWPKGIAAGVTLLLAMPWLVTGPAWGIGLEAVWNHPGARGWIYDRWTMAVVTCAGKYLFVGWFGFRFALGMVRAEYRDAAAVFGMTRFARFRSIVLPLIAPYLTVTSVIIFLLVLGEVDSLLLVSPPGFTTIPVRVYGLMHYGPSSLVASLSLLIVGVVLGIGVVSGAMLAVARRTGLFKA